VSSGTAETVTSQIACTKRIKHIVIIHELGLRFLPHGAVVAIVFIMNAEVESKRSDSMLSCAFCGGTAGVDNMKLRACDGCKSVRYCGVKCQTDHRPQHDRECKKRAAELRDKTLFKQPESSSR